MAGNEHLIQYTDAAKQKHNELDEEMSNALDAEIRQWFTEFKKDIEDREDVEGHKHYSRQQLTINPWKWITGLILVILLGGSIWYFEEQQNQQIQQLTDLVEQLIPATQVDPSGN